MASRLTAEDWPAWKGPNRNNLCLEKGLPSEWPEAGPPLAWKATGIGEGYSGPAIMGTMLYITGHQDGKQWVFALDVSKNGKQVWATDFGPVRHEGSGYPGTRATPSLDADRLYVLGIAGDLVCLDIKDGRIVWREDLVRDFGGKVPYWGYSESPLIDGPHLICTPGGKENTVLALKKTDGGLVWGSPLGDDVDYSSIVKGQFDQVEQYVNATHQGVIAVEARTGRLLWRYAALAIPEGGPGATISTCIISEDAVFATRAYGFGCARIDIRRVGDQFKAEETFLTKKMQNHYGGVVIVDGMLYGTNNPNLLTCIDSRTGEVKWSDRRPGKCSILYADGMLYCRDERGPITLVEATPAGYREKGRFEQPDISGKNAWPYPVIADGRLYIRDQDLLLCYHLK